MRAKEPRRLGALRMAKAALMNPEVQKGAAARRRGVAAGDDVAHQAAPRFDRAVPQRRSDRSGRQGSGGDRDRSRSICRRRWMPAGLERSSTRSSPRSAPRGPKDLGRVMKAVMPRLAGQAVDGKAVTEIVQAAAGMKCRKLFRAGARLNIVKGTHKPLIHPPSGFCRKAEAFFCTAGFISDTAPSQTVRIRTAVVR